MPTLYVKYLKELTIEEIVDYCKHHCNYKFEDDERKCAKRCPFGQFCLNMLKQCPCNLAYNSSLEKMIADAEIQPQEV